MSYVRDGRPPPPRPGLPEAAGLYRRFHGEGPGQLRRGRLPRTPPLLVALGELRGLIYRARRTGRAAPGAPGGRDEARTFIHFMERPPLLACDPAGRQLYVIGGRYQVTRRGIEG